ncbi:MAG TPA: PAS domain-containing protein [Phenylobacterium sp.]|uniref:PAS domain-containing protein n=1 Tax=Phenylobacterium sp. TaxID=1871053 RepID=UPI002D12E585|nr:PAS domain-containing protein [Phenylobacterium sp.]HSV02032.1 PAS domain-containing protein [Phenylobacterium sp.]
MAGDASFGTALVEEAGSGGLARRREEILDGVAEGVFSLDGQWRFTDCNRAAEAHAGIRSEEVLGKIYWEVARAAADSTLGSLLREVMATRRPAEADAPSAMKPGAVLAVRAFPISDGICVTFRDVTEARAAARREREQAERLELVLAASGLGDWSWDAASDLMTLSPKAAAVHGLPPGTTLPWARIQESLHPDDRPRVLEAVAKAIAQRTSCEVEYRIRRAGDGAEVWVMARAHGLYAPDGRPTGMLGVIGDVSAGKAQELMARESEARFRIMADCTPAPAWVTSAAGPIEFVNQAMAEWVGRPREELMGDAWLSLLHPEDLPKIVEARAAARRDLAPYIYEARFRRADGVWRTMQVSSKPRFDDAGAFQGYVGLAMDVTDTRAAQTRQRLLINELNHRVKNTLATVQSIAHQTLREAVAGREARERLTERLLALSAAHNVLTRENWESADLAEIAAEAIRPYDEVKARRITLEGPQARIAPGAALALSMALHELATNALKYGALSKAAGRVAIRWGRTGETIALEWRETGGPKVVAPARKGFGSRLLGQGLAAELGARAELLFEPEGLICRIRAPAAAP